jgi:dTDP-3-amino-2,3,6-trideoxy-4-keto-D-glucose/dTDP-3-amino-3,4,6-trideoxy-alpha-D-glucose/dTDP-2,6-dideoxy-D-kanosamine transaminase
MARHIPINDLGTQNAPYAADIHAALSRVANSGHYILGPEVEAFESAFASYCGVDHCVGVANGTDALELALRALEIGPGDEVATTANSGMYGTAAILATGAKPLFVEVKIETGLMNPDTLSHALTDRTKAVIATHLFGRLADMASIIDTAEARGIPVIEDAAQAHGAMRDGRHAGSFGALGCFSFYPTKNLGALGDGGAVTTADGALAERIRRLRQYGWTARFESGIPGGRNSRLDAIQAAVLLAKLPHLDAMNAKRRAIAKCYNEALADALPAMTALALPEVGEDHACHLFVLRHPAREALRAHLTRAGVDSDVHYPIPDYDQAAVRAQMGTPPRLPGTETFISEILTLPLYVGMGDNAIDEVIDACIEAFKTIGDQG